MNYSIHFKSQKSKHVKKRKKINIEKKNNRTKKPTHKYSSYTKKSALSFNPDIPKPKEKKINNKPEKIQKTL